jgi:hypothetical protein
MSKKESPQININADPALRQHNRTVIKPVSDNEIRGSKSSSATLNNQTVNTRDTSRLIRTIQGTLNNNTSSNPNPAAYNNTDKVLKLDDKTFVVETSKDVYVNNYQEIVEQRYFNNSEGNISAGYADGTNNYINVVSSANRLAFDESDFQVTEISTGIAKISSIGGGGGGNGATGATGPSGFSGFSGRSGVGATGVSGFSGQSGTGATGVSGFSGQSGTGATGVSGFSGTAPSVFFSIKEPYTLINNPSPVQTLNYALSSIFYITSIGANFTVNVTNLTLSANQVTNIVLLLNQAATPYIANAVQIGGAAQTVKWLGGIAPGGDANSVDVLSFSLIYNGSTYTVLGKLGTFS